MKLKYIVFFFMTSTFSLSVQADVINDIESFLLSYAKNTRQYVENMPLDNEIKEKDINGLKKLLLKDGSFSLLADISYGDSVREIVYTHDLLNHPYIIFFKFIVVRLKGDDEFSIHGYARVVSFLRFPLQKKLATKIKDIEADLKSKEIKKSITWFLNKNRDDFFAYQKEILRYATNNDLKDSLMESYNFFHSLKNEAKIAGINIYRYGKNFYDAEVLITYGGKISSSIFSYFYHKQKNKLILTRIRIRKNYVFDTFFNTIDFGL